MSEKVLAYHDKILPIQDFVVDHFKGAPSEIFPRLFQACKRFSGISLPEDRFKLHTTEMFSLAQMGSNPISLQFLEFIVKIIGAKKLLEIGSFIGVSSMSLASAGGPDSKLTTIEKFPHFAEIAKKNFVDNKLDSRIDLLVGDAFELLPEIKAKGPFDFVFIDGNKERYDRYLAEFAPLTAKGGVIIVDDSLFHGDILNDKPQTEKGQGVQKCLEYSESLKGFFKLLMPLSNGMLLLYKE